MTVSFQTPGWMDFDAAMTFGHSSKSNDNPIGYFGTGLKYAIAVILRNGGKVTINTKGKTYGFSIKAKKDHNGNDCLNVFAGNMNLRFAPTLGRNWEAWQAFRELYCNTLDERGETVGRQLRPREDFTTINVSGWEAFDKAFEERSKYFIIDREPIFKGAYAEVYRGASAGVYYRGILVHSFPEKHSAYTWNITTQVYLTEDRTMKYTHQVHTMMAATMLSMNNAELLTDLLLKDRACAEGEVPLGSCGLDPSVLFLDTVQELRRGPQGARLNKSAIDILDKERPLAGGDVVVELTARQRKMLDLAVTLLARRFPDIKQVPIIPVATLGQNTYGMARASKAYISVRAFEAGFVQVVGTIFEEYEHIVRDFRDESRDFQNYLINLVSQLLEELYLDESERMV